MKKTFRILTAAIVATAIALSAPYGAYAQSVQDPGAGWNITLEFRYTKGEEKNVNIPTNINRFGRSYTLIDKQAPVLEKNLPAERTYHWRAEGIISKEDLEEMEGFGQFEITEVEIPMERQVDVEVKAEPYPSNCVDAIPLTRQFEVSSATSPTKKGMATLTRVAVTFEIGEKDDLDLPTLYLADIVYRGAETYLATGYCEIKAVYTTKEDLDDVPQYVIVATYAPDTAPTIPIAGGGTGTGGAGTGGGTQPDPDTGGGAIVPPIDVDPGDQNGGGAIIPEEPVPEAGGNAPAFKLWMLIPILIAAAMAGILLGLILRKRDIDREREVRREAKRRAALRATGLIDFE